MLKKTLSILFILSLSCSFNSTIGFAQTNDCGCNNVFVNDNIMAAPMMNSPLEFVVNSDYQKCVSTCEATCIGEPGCQDKCHEECKHLIIGTEDMSSLKMGFPMTVHAPTVVNNSDYHTCVANCEAGCVGEPGCQDKCHEECKHLIVVPDMMTSQLAHNYVPSFPSNACSTPTYSVAPMMWDSNFATPTMDYHSCVANCEAGCAGEPGCQEKCHNECKHLIIGTANFQGDFGCGCQSRCLPRKRIRLFRGCFRRCR